MPRQQQAQVMQQQKQKNPWGQIFGMAGAILTPFLGPEAGAAAGFLGGLASGDTGQMVKSVSAGVSGAAAPDKEQETPPPTGLPTEGGGSPQPPAQIPADFVGPQVEQQAPPEQLGEGGQMPPDPQARFMQQQQEQGKVFDMLEQSMPQLPFMLQQNPQFFPAAQNFLSAAQQRWMQQRGDNNGQQ